MAMPQLQLIVVLSTFVIAAAILVLADKLLKKYKKKHEISYVYWGLGLLLFGIAAFLETLFALNYYNGGLIDLYLFLVVLVVQLLSLGSVQFVKREWIKRYYYYFSILIAIITAIAIVSTNQGNLMVNYVVAGLPSNNTIIASTIATVVSSITIVWIAAASYLKKRSWRMLSIIAGVIVVAIAGTLYIVSFPELLYYSEFLGMVLLWVGFR